MLDPKEAKNEAHEAVRALTPQSEAWGACQVLIGLADLIVYRRDPLGPDDAVAIYKAVETVARFVDEREQEPEPEPSHILSVLWVRADEKLVSGGGYYLPRCSCGWRSPVACNPFEDGGTLEDARAEAWRLAHAHAVTPPGLTLSVPTDRGPR